MKEKKKEASPAEEAPDIGKMMEIASEKKETKADTLLMLADNATFFRNGDEPYAVIPVGDHIEIRPLRGQHFHWWLTRQFYQKTKKPPDTDTINAVKNTLQARAVFDGEEHKLHNRVAWHDGDIWYDLSNNEWEAVRITKDGWEVAKPPILFRRYQHQEPQVYPIRGGDIKLILKFVNVKKDGDEILLLVHTITNLIPDIAHVILVPYGQQGSGKSALLIVQKKIIDPSKMSLLSFPKDRTELVQQLDHHWYAPYDNVDRISQLISDELCKAVTGAGNSKRALYTDNEDVISVYKRCIAMNGINCAAIKPDILDRCLLMELERIDERNRMTDEELWAAFETAKPAILGGAFDVLSAAMKLKPKIKLPILPRMAGFALWGYAIAEVLGYGGQVFLDAYFSNIEAQNKEAIVGDVIGEALLELMNERNEWKGTANELLCELEMVAETLKISTKTKSWPKAGNSLTRRLNYLKTNLQKENLKYENSKSGERKIRITKIGKGDAKGIEGTENTAQTARPPKSESGDQKKMDDTMDDIEDDTIPPNISSTISPKEKQHHEEEVGRLDDIDDISLNLGKEMCQKDKIKLILNTIPPNNTTTTEKIQKETGLPEEYITAVITHLKTKGQIIEFREGVYRRIL
jgi:hypothetical protein